MSPTKQDDETAKDSITPDFLKGIDISPEEEQEMEAAAYSGAANDIAQREGLSGDDLKAAEANPSTDTAKSAADPKEGYKAGFGYRDEDLNAAKKSKQKAKGNFLNRNKKLLIGGGLGGGVAGLVLSFMLLLPLKVQHMVNNLQEHFFASSEKATQDMTDKLFTQYVIRKVVPGMASSSSCTTTHASKSCVSPTPGDGPIAKLYNAWHDKNLEGKLAENQGLEIRKEGNNFYLKSNRLASDVKLGTYDPKDPAQFEKAAFGNMSRGDVRRETRRAFENETFAKRVMYHYKVGRLLERKYSIKRCLVACESRDARADRKALRKLKWKAYFINRIVTPRNTMLGIAMKCAIGGFTCTEPGDAGDDGERASQLETETRAEIKVSGFDTAELQKDAEDINKNGLTNHIIAKLTNQTIADVATKAVPIVGWLQLAAQLNKGLNDIGPALTKMNYVINSTSMVSMYMMYRTNADEIKTGQADAADIGIVADSLGPDAGTDQGGAGAEGAPIYNDIMGSSTVKTASIFSAFVPTAHAASSGYPCNEGSKITTGACPELALNQVNLLTGGVNSLSKMYTSIESVPIFAGVSPNQAANIWLQTGGKLYEAAGGLIGKITDGTISLISKLPGVGSAIDYVKGHVEDFVKLLATWFAKLFVNDIFGASPSGGRNFEVAAGGADVAGNTYAHYGLGAHRISDAAAAEIRVAMKEQAQEDFNHESTFARMFDTSSQHSLVSRFALALPTTTTSGAMRSMATSLVNPFSSFAVPFSAGNKASAASTADPYGVSQYGYSDSDEVLNSDNLQTYWDTHDCSNPNRAKEWGDFEKKNVNPATGMPENDLANGCALISTGVQMSGAMFDDSLIPPDELGSDSISNPTSTDTTSTLPAACYTVTKLTGSKIEGNMLHKEPNLPINTYAKENSPQGIKYAATHNYDSIDLDIQITKDGIPINTHWGQPMAKDGFYDPLHKLNANTQVTDMTLAEVTRLRNNDGQSQIYSLEDQIKVLAANHVNLSLEIKTAALVKTYPQITGWLNSAGVKAYIKGDASKPSLDKALTDARNFGYWTRGTLGSQDWKAPGPNCVQ